ncbi:unnamed protein product [Adineta steineri]|uniref:Metalloendopeptidase n=1 Tax=Adineta steineri TaxID=433720 RepID=A0A818RGS3_9BILA|nr:unnamed protein product [Adineta steineri]CAF3649310.1 unnamed protein product [Adineta steineri]
MMKPSIIKGFLLYYIISLTGSSYAVSLIRPPYLTPEDFERGKTLTPEERGYNSSTLRQHFSQHFEIRTNVWFDSKYKWPNARVPYIISSQYNDQERAVVAESIREWESKTCIRFIPKSNNDRDYLELTPQDGTNNYCYSYVGRQGGRQFVKMYAPICMSVGQYVHELGHAIGFGHEHQRPDRDHYIRINWANIDPQFYYAFDKYNSNQFTTMGMAYDYYSIMHYPDYSYSNNGKPTLVPTYPGHNIHNMNVILSPTDIQKTKKYYNC